MRRRPFRVARRQVCIGGLRRVTAPAARGPCLRRVTAPAARGPCLRRTWADQALASNLAAVLRRYRHLRRGLGVSAARQSFGRPVQVWWNMLVPVDRPVVCAWTMGTFAAAAGIAEPTRADPATPSARIVGIIKARPMRMTPPPNFRDWQGAVAPGLVRLNGATVGGIPFMRGK